MLEGTGGLLQKRGLSNPSATSVLLSLSADERVSDDVIAFCRPGGAVGEWTCSSLENKTTGKKTKKPFTGVNLFDVGADGLITGLRLVLDHTENINTNGTCS